MKDYERMMRKDQITADLLECSIECIKVVSDEINWPI